MTVIFLSLKLPIISILNEARLKYNKRILHVSQECLIYYEKIPKNWKGVFDSIKFFYCYFIKTMKSKCLISLQKQELN